MGLIFSKFWQRLFKSNPMRIIMVGLDAAGKSTILYRLELGEILRSAPIVGLDLEQVRNRNISITSWDTCGYRWTKPYLKTYYENVQGIIFVFDSTDVERINEAREELQAILREDQLREAAVLVFANKQDLPNAISVNEVVDNLGISNIRERKWFVQGSCAVSREGLYEGIDWLSRILSVRKN